MEAKLAIVPMTETDWEQVQTIYYEGMQTGNATFQTKPPSWEEWDRRHLQVCRLVARLGEDVVGFAALTPYSSVLAYAGVAEVSIYIGEQHRGKRVGSTLLQALIVHSEQHGFWTLQAGIFPENTQSLALHQRFGFREVGRRIRIGRLHGVWRDVVLLERRSRLVGMEDNPPT